MLKCWPMSASAVQLTREPVRRFTVAEFHRMAEAGVFEADERLELLEGEILMTPPQGPAHAEVSYTLAQRLSYAYGSRFMVRQHSPLACGDTTEPEPDIVVVPNVSYRERHPRGAEALLVVEVAQTSHDRDRRKVALYAKAGVPCYWLVDLPAALVVVHHGLTQTAVLSVSQRCSPPGCSVAWTVAELLGV